MEKKAYSESIVEQARFIDDFARFMSGVGDYWVGGGWCASLISGKLLREHGGVDVCVESEYKSDLLDFLLENKFMIKAETDNKLVALKGDKDRQLKAYIVLMDYDNEHFTFSTEKFYKNIRVPTHFFRKYECGIREGLGKHFFDGAWIENGVTANTLTPALFVTSKLVYGKNMRPKDKTDIEAVIKKLEEPGMEEEKALFEKEKKALMAYT